MKKLILIVALVLILSTSAFATLMVYDLTGYNATTPELSALFWATPNVSSLSTWMQANFDHTPHFLAFTPVQQFITKNQGDCNDMSTFVLYFWARKFGSSGVKQVFIRLNEGFLLSHMLAVGSSGTWYTSNQYYYSGFGSIAACVADWDRINTSYSVNWYNVYDYDLNFISSSKSPAGVADGAPID
jgi:hypothetical protein